MQYQFNAYVIETLTNTHVGSGDVQYGVVDNMIQRDQTTRIPVFHASSLKGALKDHFRGLNGDGIDMKTMIDEIFGSEYEAESDKKNGDQKPGKAIFCEARLLTIPLRASMNVYYQCSSPMVLIDYLRTYMELVDKGSDKDAMKSLIHHLETKKIAGNFALAGGRAPVGLEIEDYGYGNDGSVSQSLGLDSLQEFEKYVDVKAEQLVLFNDTLFGELCENAVPVIARNKIGADGISENLFYEELLPRRSRLYFMLGKGEINDNELYENFCKILTAHPVQFGADYSIGHGLCHIRQLPVTEGGQNESPKN